MAERNGYRQLLDERHQEVMSALSEIRGDVKAQNGRVRKAEVAIAILQWGYGLGALVLSAWFYHWFQRP